MELHARAALTLKQRQEVKRLHVEERVSIRKLAALYHVNETTIQRWNQTGDAIGLEHGAGGTLYQGDAGISGGGD